MNISPIKHMEQLASEMGEVISLSQGTPCLNTDIYIRQQVIEALHENKVDKYSLSMGILPLREKIQQKLFAEGMRYDMDEILISAGGIEGLAAVLFGLFREGDELLVPTPGYAAYFSLAELAKIQVVTVPLDETQNWSLPVKSLKSYASPRTKAILLCNPNNPTGTVYSREQLLEIYAFAIENNLLVILDDIYGSIVFDEKKIYSPCVDEELKKNTIRIVSFSKDFAMTGWRVGFIHGPREYMQQILAVHDALISCAPVISQYAALAALDITDRVVAQAVKTYTYHREFMGSMLSELTGFLDFTWPEGAYFFFPRIHEVTNSQQFALDLLRKAKVAVAPGTAFGPEGEGHIRLCFGRSEEEIREGMKRFIGYFKEGKV